jgi:hypothetical protein
MVTRRIESGRKRQNVGGAKLDTKPTPLAALNGDGNETFGQDCPPDVIPYDACTSRATK